MATRKPRKAAGKSLRVVADGEKPPRQRKLTVAQAAATGDHRQLLVAMRDRIARAVSAADCPPRDLAALTRRLQDVAKDLEALDARESEEAEEASSAPSSDEQWTAI